VNWASIQRMDRRIIYAALIVVLSFPLFKPVGIPLVGAEITRKAFDFIDQLPQGAVVVFSTDTGVASQGEQYPQASVLFEQVTRREDIKLILITFWEQGTIYFTDLQKANPVLQTRTYGEQWVDLGYVPGAESAMAAVGDDFHKVLTTDARGNAISSLPLMADVLTAKDVDLLITISAGTPGVPEFQRQWNARHGTPMVAAVLSQFATIYMPYVNSGQLVGLLGGLRAAAEYEQYLGLAGTAGRAMDALSLSHVMVILFVGLANVAHFMQRRKAQ